VGRRVDAPTANGRPHGLGGEQGNRGTPKEFERTGTLAERRGKGEGSIRKRPDGRWEASVEIEAEPGIARRRKYIYGRTRREVQERLVVYLNELQDGTAAKPNRETVARYLEHWLELKRLSVKPRSLEFYTHYVRAHIIPHVGKVQLTKLSEKQIETMYAQLHVKLAAQTVQHCRAVLRNALNHAVRRRLIPRNPATLAEAPRVPRHEIKPLGAEEVKRFLTEAQEDRLCALYLLAVTSGLRQGELYGLRWSDIDFPREAIRVNATLHRQVKAWELAEPKSATSRRMVAIPRFVIEALKEHRKRQVEERLASRAWQENELVFCSIRGTPLRPQNVQRRSFKPLLRKAGLPDIRFHDLRHTAASLLLRAGEHPKVVQERLGHSSIALTMDLYSHLIDNMQAAAAEKLQRLLG
jgi:integrase